MDSVRREPAMCGSCGSRVFVVTGAEGTSHFEPNQPYETEQELAAEVERLQQALDRMHGIAGHLCVAPDEVGRSCGECLPCQLWAAARRAFEAAALAAEAADIGARMTLPANPRQNTGGTQ